MVFDPERTKGRSQLAEALGIGAVAAAHREGLVVEPEKVAALGGGLALESGQDRHAKSLEGRRDGLLFAAALGLAHAVERRRPSSVTITGSWVKMASA